MITFDESIAYAKTVSKTSGTNSKVLSGSRDGENKIHKITVIQILEYTSLTDA